MAGGRRRRPWPSFLSSQGFKVYQSISLMKGYLLEDYLLMA